MEAETVEAGTAGELLRALRIRAGLTQVQLAQRLGCQQGTVSSTERGIRAYGHVATPRLAALDLAGRWVEATQATPEECRRLLLLAAQTPRTAAPRAA